MAFALELAAMAAYAYWGWTQHEGILQILLAVGVPAAAAAIWGVFRVPNDPGKALVPVSGPVRLLLEWCFYAGAAAALFTSQQPQTAAVFAAVTAVHYLTGYDRVLRMLTNKPRQ